MSPTILDGETVRIRPLRPADLRRGAILLYRKNGQPVLHRLLRKNAKTGALFFSGDAALHGQDRVDARDLAGIATAVQREGCTLPLNTPAHRLRGSLRYHLRPLRRIWAWIQPDHIKTSRG